MECYCQIKAYYIQICRGHVTCVVYTAMQCTAALQVSYIYSNSGLLIVLLDEVVSRSLSLQALHDTVELLYMVLVSVSRAYIAVIDYIKTDRNNVSKSCKQEVRT